MRRIFLEYIELINFMGVKRKRLDLDREINFIAGANGTGKTTFNTGFRWLMFNKDVNDKSDFNIKTIDSNGKIKHGLEHTVEAGIAVEEGDEGRFTPLKKIFKEIWRKPKQQENAKFAGHETLYYFDEVPELKKDYDKKLDQIISENTFKIITDPLYFSTQLHWKEQRKILIEVTGDISHDVIIGKNDALTSLDLEGKGIDEYRKMVKERRAKFNDELEAIPPRIDENEKGKRQENFVEIRSEMLECKRELNEIEKFLEEGIDEDPDRKQKKDLIVKLKTEVEDIQRTAKYEFEKDFKELKSKINSLSHDTKEKEENAAAAKNHAKKLSERNQEIEQKLIDLRRKWNEENEKEFKTDIETVCPTCGQDFPEDMLKDELEGARFTFNKNKADKLEEITSTGKKLSEEKQGNEVAISNYADMIAHYETEVKELSSELDKLSDKLSLMEYEDPAEVNEMIAQIGELEADLERSAGINEAYKIRASKLERKAQLQKEIENLQSILAFKTTNEEADKRIEALKKKAKELAQKIANIEKQEYLAQQYVKTKVELLQEKINKRFKHVNFRLFETQVNGEIDEVCKALVNGVPFADANRAGKINAGIDIINTLSEYYQVSAPIWIDNRESITDLIPTKAQVINLNVVKEFTEIFVNPTPMDYVRAEEEYKKKYPPYPGYEKEAEEPEKKSLFD